jgi:hypothetical protein
MRWSAMSAPYSFFTAGRGQIPGWPSYVRHQRASGTLENGGGGMHVACGPLICTVHLLRQNPEFLI